MSSPSLFMAQPRSSAIPTMATRRTVCLLTPLEDQAGIDPPSPALKDMAAFRGISLKERA
jgi:hypothetical protein